MRGLKAFLVVAFLVSAPMVALALEGNVQLFNIESEAQKHCPADVVVWLNSPSGIYHFKGMRWYGNTNRGGGEQVEAVKPLLITASTPSIDTSRWLGGFGPKTPDRRHLWPVCFATE